MLYVFGFEKICVVLGDLYFVDPEPLKGQEGAEHGVRLELRVIVRGERKESIYAATPIAVDQPIWRADFLEAVGGKPFDRTHHHPVPSRWAVVQAHGACCSPTCARRVGGARPGAWPR